MKIVQGTSRFVVEIR